VSSVVLDTSALLALVHGESGAERVQSVCRGASISTVNLAEALAKMQGRGIDRRLAVELLDALEMTVCDFDRDQAISAASFRNATKAKGLSLGDRCCLALALSRRLPALTADRTWRHVEVGVEIELIR